MRAGAAGICVGVRRACSIELMPHTRRVLSLDAAAGPCYRDPVAAACASANSLARAPLSAFGTE